MKITGYTEIDDETYDENLRLAFSDFIGDDSIEHNKENLIRCITDKFECDYPDFIIDDDSIDKAISDLKKAIKLLLSNID